MASAANVVAFLSSTSPAFDFSQAFVMAGAIGLAFLPFQTLAGWHGLQGASILSQRPPKPALGGVKGGCSLAPSLLALG